MKLTLSGALYHNIRYRLSRLGVVLLIVLVGVYLYLQLSIVMLGRQTTQQQHILDQRNQELNQLLSDATFMQLENSRYLLNNLRQLPWSVHIPKVIGMVDTIQSLDGADGGAVQLSDLQVSLESLSLRGTVSNLLLLYRSAPERGYLSLLDRFAQLDFIENMRVQNYTRDQDGGFSFVLQATVIHDDHNTQ